MEHRFLGICIFFIGILIYLYKKRNTEIREHFNMKTIAEAKNPLLKNPDYLQITPQRILDQKMVKIIMKNQKLDLH